MVGRLADGSRVVDLAACSKTWLAAFAYVMDWPYSGTMSTRQCLCSSLGTAQAHQGPLPFGARLLMSEAFRFGGAIASSKLLLFFCAL